jgi:hypothetical protein
MIQVEEKEKEKSDYLEHLRQKIKDEKNSGSFRFDWGCKFVICRIVLLKKYEDRSGNCYQDK